jgi:hypothetical protein
LRRTNADKRKAVKTLLEDEEWSKWSDREIARQCEVSHPFVSKMKEKYLETFPDKNRKVSRNGTEYQVDTSGISESNKDRAKIDNPNNGNRSGLK